ncbi:mitochondrial fission ELM1 family protein [Candidatus Pelagibacter sp.]|nr:mitochondrial fission ELM1 family protein [Candidatus Pelagibacter sp.]|tara:strand:+ start:555 stop:1505 length:951 start_codon:yes stop_codon:yes gene_type:complete
MNKLKGLLLTEGMHGMISQVEGLAKSLNIEFIHEKIELNSFWKLIPPKFTPSQSFTFKNDIKKNFDIVISCGRKSVIPSIYLKKKYKDKIMNIHIQDPKVSLNNFDYVVVPQHDSLNGNNVITSIGAIHYLKQDELDQNENYLKNKINKEKIISLIIGGPNKYYNYNDKSIGEIFAKIQKNFIDNGYQLIVIPSMRTPQKIINKATNYFDKNQVIINNVDKKAYLSSLKLADYIVVTCDSTSMISEAAITGKPIYVAQMTPIKKNYRFEKFFNLFRSLNIIRNLEGSVEKWNYEKLNETDKVSNHIKKKFKDYDFS